jgi:phosphoglucomutase
MRWPVSSPPAATYDIATGNDADADRHGIVTPDAGLMNPNHYLAAAIDYLLDSRTDWPTTAGIGKTVVTSSIVDRVVAAHDRSLFEVPVGFKWFVPGLLDSALAFGGEESAGASFLRRDGKVWSTDKDGIVLALLAAEMTAQTGQTPSQRYAGLAANYGTSAFARQDAPATRGQKAKLGALDASQVSATTVGGEPVKAVLTSAPGNNAPIGGLKVTTDNAWFAVRPSGTEDVYKIYAESLRDDDHLRTVQHDARTLVDGVLK